jgi:hypothetical protein
LQQRPATLGREKNDMTTMHDHHHRVRTALRFLRWVCTVCLALAVFAPEARADGDVVWASAMGGEGENQGYRIAVDAAGNVYTTGWIEGMVDTFGPGPGSVDLTSAGNTAIFVSKQNADGDLEWARIRERTLQLATIACIACGRQRNDS